jgi:hypothetical protein
LAALRRRRSECIGKPIAAGAATPAPKDSGNQ